MMRTFLVLGLLAAFDPGMVIDAQARRAPGPPQGVTIKNPNDPSLDMTAPTVTISTPTSGTTHDAGTDTVLASLAGTSADASGVASCRWVNNLGGSGNATTSGAGGWAVSNIALTVGSNVITVTCLDPGNNAGTDVLTVTRSSAVADGAHIWVDTDGGTCVDNASPVVYATATACAITAVAAATDAGDLVRVRPGTYASVVTETTNGSAGSEITYVADGAVTINGFVLQGDYTRVIGFTVECGGVRGSGLDISNADNVELWHNTVQNCTDDAIRTDSGGQTSSGDNNLIIGNIVLDTFSGGGDTMDFQIRGHGNLLAYNESDGTEVDFLYLFGSRNRIINNYWHGINSAPISHTDFFQTGGDAAFGFGQLLFEANFQADETGEDHHCMNLEASGANDAFHIFRRNVFTSNIAVGTVGQCYAVASSMDDTKFYHETISYAGLYNNVVFGSDLVRSAWLNNIFAPSWRNGVAPTLYDYTPPLHNYNLYFESGETVDYPANVDSEANSQRNVNPLFVNPSAGTRDFRLQAGSPAINAGSALTTTSGSGTGTTFNVATGGGGFFRGADTTIAQYSGNLAKGDWITVGTDLVQIASIATDAITVTTSLTWANGDPVYLGDDTTPDIGAYPYKAGGYTLSATYAGSGTITITPNDASLVRWVVCYDSNVPYAVDNSSPYTCAAPSGTFSARVYPLYPSKVLWAVATP